MALVRCNKIYQKVFILHSFKVQRVLIEFNIILRLFKLYSEKGRLVSTRIELAPRFFLFDISIQKMIKIIFEMLKNKLKNKSIKEKSFNEGL